MNKIPFLILFVLFTSTLWAQETTRSNKSLKLYTNAITNQNYYRNNGLNAFYLTPALVINTDNGNSWEFEVSHLKYRDYNKETNKSRKIIGGNVKEFEVFLRAEYAHHFSKNKPAKPAFQKGRLQPILGLSATPFFQKQSQSFWESTFSQYSTSQVGAYLSVIPRIEYYLSEKIFLDLNLPIDLLSLKYISEHDDDPTLPIKSRNKTDIQFDAIAGLGLRLGVGLVL